MEVFFDYKESRNLFSEHDEEIILNEQLITQNIITKRV